MFVCPAESCQSRRNRRAGVPAFAPCLVAVFVLFAVFAGSTRPANAETSSTSGRAIVGGIGLRLVDVPRSELSDPRARLYIVDHLSAGTVIERGIEVSNTTGSSVSVALYAAAATIADGSFFGTAGRTPNELSKWTSVSPSGASIPAGGHIMAKARIAVPRTASSGERYGAVWAQVSSPLVAGGQITEVSRVGIRMYISVGYGEAPSSSFTINSLTAARSKTGQPVVMAMVHNTGGLALDMSGTLQLSSGPGGLSAGPFAANLGTTLAIGDTEPVTIALDRRLPAGPWDARIMLQSGLLRRSAQATITFPESGTASPVKATPIRPAWLYPVFVGIAAFLLLGATSLLVTRRQQRRRPINALAHK